MNFWGRNRCYNGGQQHLFEARYDEVPLQMEFETRRLDADEVRRMLYRNIYVRDVCVWCGKTIERGAKE